MAGNALDVLARCAIDNTAFELADGLADRVEFLGLAAHPGHAEGEIVPGKPGHEHPRRRSPELAQPELGGDVFPHLRRGGRRQRRYLGLAEIFQGPF